MKQFFKMFFASFLAMVVIGVIVFGLTVGLIAGFASDISDEKKEAAPNSVLSLDMDRFIHEVGETNPFAAFGGGSGYVPGLYDLTRALDHAREDKNIKGLYIRMGWNPNGWATLEQLREALLNFRKSGKFIYAYGELAAQKSYYLASVADSIFLNPSGFTEFNGLSSEIPFFKGSLQKLEVEPEIFYAGKFKSATEPFRADKISEPNREQIAALQADIWNELTTAVATHAGVSPSTADNWAQTGAVRFPSDAQQFRLVDRLAYSDEVEAVLRAKTGRKADEKINFIGLDEYAADVRRKRKTKDSRIALLYAEGSISDGEASAAYEIASEDFIAQIRKIRRNDKIKAVVLRVNSPGGSALASEVILRELQLLRQKKPVIVSMGDMAASGGYYIACQADSIFALPNTITGSIGVFTMLFNAENLLKNKLGITFDEVKNAPYADFPSVTRPLTPDEAARMQSHVDTIYRTFVRRVAAGRRMTEAMVDSVAQGRVWSGTDALGIGLVDGLGGLERAIWSAARKAGLKDYQVVTYPEPVDRFESIMRTLGGGQITAEAAKAVMDEQLGEEHNLIRQLQTLKKMNGRAQMAMPFQLHIR